MLDTFIFYASFFQDIFYFWEMLHLDKNYINFTPFTVTLVQLVQFSFQTLQIKKLCFPKYHMLNVHISFLEGSLNKGNSATGACTSSHRLPTAHCRASQQFKLVCSSRIYHLSEE